MVTNDDPKDDVKKWSLTSSKTSMVIGSVAVLAVCMLAGLVFTRYEAGIPPAEAVPAIAQNQLIRVAISEQSLAIRHDRPAVVGGVCSAEGPATS